MPAFSSLARAAAPRVASLHQRHQLRALAATRATAHELLAACASRGFSSTRDLAQATTQPPPSSQLADQRTAAATPPVAPNAASTPVPAAAASSSSSTGAGSSTGGGGKNDGPKPNRFVRFLRTSTRLGLATIAIGTVYIVWTSEMARHPGEQLPHDPELPTLVVVGNGWASTSFLKNLDNERFNVIVISPRNYFLFTPLLPSVTVGTLASRSIMQPTRFLTRHLKRRVDVYEGEVTDVDPATKMITFEDKAPVEGQIRENTLKYDYLVYAIGAENQTFGIKGVRENACFLKEIWDAEKIRARLLDCLETAAFAGQPEKEVERLLSMIVVGGGPTGVEFAGELHDFLSEDLADWYPEIAGKIKIRLIEALPSVLPMFSRELISYTMSNFEENKIDVLTKTMVKEVNEKSIVAQNEKKELVEFPYGLLVWATGNTARDVTRGLMSKLPNHQNNRRGLLVDDHLRLLGTDGIYALGDCTATNYAPTAQAASQQGRYLSRAFLQLGKAHKLRDELEAAKRANEPLEKIEQLAKALWKASTIRPFHYTHQGSLAYIGSDKAIADLPFGAGNFATGGVATYYFWRSAYMSQLFSLRNRVLVGTDWLKTRVLGRDVSRG